MSVFQDEVGNIAGESVFTHIELAKLFETDEEQENFLKVRAALAKSTNINQTTAQIISWGNDAVSVLVKLGKYALTA